MYAIAYDAAGTIWGVARGENRYELKRALTALSATKPGFEAIFVSGSRARVGDVYAVGRTRRQWFRGEHRSLTDDERKLLRVHEQLR
jgi:hypothetical protein